MLSHGLLLVMMTSSSLLVRISGFSKCVLYSHVHSVIERALDLHSIHSFLIVFP
jgi:hypothetical protein